MATGLATTVSQNTDGLSIHAEPTSGSYQSLVQLQLGASEIGYGSSIVGIDAHNGDPPFDDIDPKYDLMQLPSFYWLGMSMCCRTSDDYEYVSDLRNVPITMGMQAYSFYPELERAVKHAIPEDELEIVEVGAGGQSGELAAGTVDATYHLHSNEQIPSYIQEVHSSSDTRLLGWKDETIESIENDDRVMHESRSVDNDWYRLFDETVPEGDVFEIISQYTLFSSSNVPAEPVNELLTVAWENIDQLQDTHVAFNPWAEPEFWTRYMVEEVPVHPGAVSFLKEQDLWKDELTEGSL